MSEVCVIYKLASAPMGLFYVGSHALLLFSVVHIDGTTDLLCRLLQVLNEAL